MGENDEGDKKYSVALARQHLAEVLDLAEAGELVVIERRGVRFIVSATPEAEVPVRRKPRVELADPEIASGSWSWSWSPDGGATMATATPRRRRKHA